MELTDGHLEVIRETAKKVESGSITIHIAPGTKKLKLNVQNYITVQEEPEKEPASKKRLVKIKGKEKT